MIGCFQIFTKNFELGCISLVITDSQNWRKNVMKVATSINRILTDKIKPKWHLCDVSTQNYVVKCKTDWTRFSNKLHVTASTLIAALRFSRRNIKENQFHVVNAQNGACIKTFLQCRCMKINSICSNFKNKLRTKTIAKIELSITIYYTRFVLT